MYDRMVAIIEDEMHKITDKGLNNANLETTYKLIDMVNNLKQVEYWEKVQRGMADAGYYDEDNYRRGNNGRERENRYGYANDSNDMDRYRRGL